MSIDGGRLNWIVLIVFAPILILAGVLGFVLPESAGLTSGAPAYNWFHIAFGTLGLLLALTKKESYARAFNLGFGLIDLYQAAASFLHLFPENHFRWTRADDVLHVVIGALLVGVALYGRSGRGART
jgi:Na+/H+-dicarboxylate symporter